MLRVTLLLRLIEKSKLIQFIFELSRVFATTGILMPLYIIVCVFSNHEDESKFFACAQFKIQIKTFFFYLKQIFVINL